MAPNADPWRTLGLAPGATQDEIRRAYRRLAKANHPDAAGEAALPRFLAIQSAYEQLAGPGRIRRVGARPGARATDPRPAADPREPWRADPDRARASGRADGRRTPGARPAPGNPPGAAGPGRPPAGPPGAASRGEPAGGRARRSSTRRRPANRATPGSTSYEGADEEPFEPGWTGATWYGASSGTYWTINPKEYADPRKHGPEYQARARRGRDPRAPEDRPADGPLDGHAAEGPVEGPAEPASPGRPPSADRPPATPSASAAGQPPADEPPASARPADSGSGSGFTAGPVRRPSGDGTWTASAAGAPAWTSPGDARPADPAAGDRLSGGASRHGGVSGPSSPASSASPPVPPGSSGGRLGSWIEQPDQGAARGPLLRRPTTTSGRLGIAILGWAPLGVFVTAVIDGTTGCGSYSAGCPEVYAPGTWLVQAAILFLLVVLPRLASWSAHGAIAALIAGVPAAVALSAAGGSNVRETSGPILLGVLAAAYLGGVAYAIAVTRRQRSA